MNIFLLFFIVLAILQAADAWLTYRIIDAGGRELNPVMRFLIARLGLVPGLLLPKVALLVLLALFLPAHPVFMLLIDCLYAWVVAHNLLQSRKIGGAA
jgi:nitrate/nitrite transporter NarK